MSPAQAPPDVDGAHHRRVAVDTADAGRIDLHVLEAGEGPPVLLLHGWPQHAWCWRHVIPRLAGDFRLIAPDLRGFGWSGVTEGGYDPVTFASDAIALLDSLEIERAHVVGHDWGGATAFVMALAHPERVQRLLVLNSVPPWVEVSPQLIAGAWRSWYAVVMAAAGDLVLRRRPGSGLRPAERAPHPADPLPVRCPRRGHLAARAEGPARPRRPAGDRDGGGLGSLHLRGEARADRPADPGAVHASGVERASARGSPAYAP